MAIDKRPSDEISQRAFSAMLRGAFMTWQNAILIGFFIVAFFAFQVPFAGAPTWFWLAFGAVAEIIYMVATLTDPVASAQAVSRMFAEKFNPGDIKNLSARQRLQKALEYKRSIDAFVDRQTGALKANLTQTANEITSWIALIYRLARAIDTFEGNPIIDRDRRNVPTELENLKRRLSLETDPSVKNELQEAIAIREKLLENLQSIANTVKRIDIKLDNTLAQLSTVYAQMQLIDTKEVDGGRAQRLRTEIQDEIASLSDTISAMDEVYQYQGYKNAASSPRLPPDNSETVPPAASRGSKNA